MYLYKKTENSIWSCIIGCASVKECLKLIFKQLIIDFNKLFDLDVERLDNSISTNNIYVNGSVNINTIVANIFRTKNSSICKQMYKIMFEIACRLFEINDKDIIELFVAENIIYMFDLKNRSRKPGLDRKSVV